MAILEKNNIPVYETFIEQELERHDHRDEKVMARALVKLPVGASQWLLLGGSAAGTAQTCVIAVTSKTLLMILTKQDLVETPEMVQSSIFPLEKVTVLKVDKGWAGSSFLLNVDGRETKLQFVKLSEWSSLEELTASLSK